MKNCRLIFTLMLGFCVALAAATAGGGAQNSESSPIRWMTSGDSGARPMVPNDRIVTGINQKFGINLQVDIVPQDNFDRINIAMASGDFPDIVTGALGNAATQSWIDNGMVIPFNSYFNTDTWIQSRLIPNYTWSADANGNYYGIPFITGFDSANYLLATRSDWLDKVGMKFPTTLDEFKAVLMAFKTKDPSGTGKSVYGLTAGKNAGFDFIFYGYGRKYADYQLDSNGNVIPNFEDPSFIPGMTYLKDLWDNGLIDPEYMLNDTPKQEEKFYQGQIGFFGTALYRHVSRIENNLKQISPNANLVYGPPPKGPNGVGCAQQGKGGYYTCITKACKTPDKAAAFINFMLSPEGNDYVRLGIEGIHYTKQGDTIIYNEAERDKDAFSPNGWCHPLAWGSFYWPLDTGYLPNTEPSRDRALESKQIATEYMIPNLVKYSTQAEIREGSIVNDIFQQYFQDMLTGKISIQQGVANLSRDWRAQGGDRILADLTAAYKASQQ